jgi:hypothetical protein
MLYFGQEVGEAGNENAGFGTRSNLFWLWGSLTNDGWMEVNLMVGNLQIRERIAWFYKRLLNFTISPALMGEYQDLQFKPTNYWKLWPLNLFLHALV